MEAALILTAVARRPTVDNEKLGAATQHMEACTNDRIQLIPDTETSLTMKKDISDTKGHRCARPPGRVWKQRVRYADPQSLKIQFVCQGMKNFCPQLAHSSLVGQRSMAKRSTATGPPQEGGATATQVAALHPPDFLFKRCLALETLKFRFRGRIYPFLPELPQLRVPLSASIQPTRVRLGMTLKLKRPLLVGHIHNPLLPRSSIALHSSYSLKRSRIRTAAPVL